MRKLPLVITLILLATCFAVNASAGEAPERISRQCATTVPLINYSNYAYHALGLRLDGAWVMEHGPELAKEFEPSCAKLADCLEGVDNTFMFCDDHFVLEIRPVCDKHFSRETQYEEWDSCRSFAELYALDVDGGSVHVWRKAQAWRAAQPPDPSPSLDVTIAPDHLVPGVPTNIVVTALDHKTGVPVYALVNIGGKSFRSKENPAAVSSSFYPFKYSFAFDRVKNAEGRYELASPEITIEAPHYPVVRTRFAAETPRITATVKPSGRGRIVVDARDATTGAPVDGVVLVGDTEAGPTNEPISIQKGTTRDVWVRADGYADTRAETHATAEKK